MILRDPARFSQVEYDILIVGGGIQGANVFLDATERGLSTILLEKDDFGGGTSWNSLRILHGGLRYLQTADLPRFVESVRARRWFFARFPELVQPLRCRMPLRGAGLKRPSVLRIALGVNDALSWRRNAGVEASAHIPNGSVDVADRQVLELVGWQPARAPRIATWYDGLMSDPAQILMAIIRGGCVLGGSALNYVDVTELLSEKGQVTGVSALDRVSEEEFRFRARRVVVCTGSNPADLDRIRGLQAEGTPPPSLAFNILIRKPLPVSDALAVEIPERDQVFFLHPVGALTLAGTVHERFAPEDLPLSVASPAVQSFIGALRSALPGWQLAESDVTRVLWGILPATGEGETTLAKRPTLLDHARSSGVAGVLSAVPIKFTTSPTFSADALRAVIGRDLPKRTGTAPRPVRKPSWSQFLDLSVHDRGSATALLRSIQEQESVIRVEDLVYRRADWGLEPEGAEEALEIVSRLTGAGAG